MLYDRARLDSTNDPQGSLDQHDARVRKQSRSLVTDASYQSIVTTMDRFVKAVNEMNTHVILPTMLLDVEDSPSEDVPVLLRGTNARYEFYKALNVIKKDLVLGISTNDEDSDDSPLRSSRTSPLKVLPTSSSQQDLESTTRRLSTSLIPKPHSSDNLPMRKISLNMPLSQEHNAPSVNSFRRQDSWASIDPSEEQQQPTRRKSGLASVTNVRPEFNLQMNSDSGAEFEEDITDVLSPVEMADQLREHLQELQIGLHHLTHTAKYITRSID